MHLKTSIIIPTYNRPEELSNCIASILIQSRIPDELIIVDDGSLPEFPFKRDLETNGTKCIYIKKETPGLTASRNCGVQIASGDIVFFFDDDVTLEKHYIEEILNIYQGDSTGKVGGVGGTVTNRNVLTIKDFLLWFLETLFLINGFNEGRVLPSGFCVDYGTTPFRIRKSSKVDFLAGCAMSFRMEVFREFSFDTLQYVGYGLGEDKDFSFKISRKYRLIITPEAQLLHLESTKMRFDKELMSHKYVISNYIFFSHFKKKNIWNWAFFAYGLFGYLLIRTCMFFASPRKENLARLKGILNGIADIFRNRVSTV